MKYNGDRHFSLFPLLTILPSDYDSYGGAVVRDDTDGDDCSCGCKHWIGLEGDLGLDWGVCTKPDGERRGLLTFEHQAGATCYEQDDMPDA